MRNKIQFFLLFNLQAAMGFGMLYWGVETVFFSDKCSVLNYCLLMFTTLNFPFVMMPLINHTDKLWQDIR